MPCWIWKSDEVGDPCGVPTFFANAADDVVDGSIVSGGFQDLGLWFCGVVVRCGVSFVVAVSTKSMSVV